MGTLKGLLFVVSLFSCTYITEQVRTPTCTINLVDAIVQDRERVARNIRSLLPRAPSLPAASAPLSAAERQLRGNSEVRALSVAHAPIRTEGLVRLSSVPMRSSSIPIGGREDIDDIYRDFARRFNLNVSSSGYDRFVAAVDEIYAAYRNECTHTIGIPSGEDLALLTATFREMMSQLHRIPEERLAQARSIYGKFLCYNERAEPPATTRRGKRQTNLPTRCSCPAIVTQPCEFFACLNVSVVKFIAGFGNTFGDLACIGFIVDTTGSMWEEITAARRIILQFMRSQADSTFCYVLVPFNDHGFGHPRNVGPIDHTVTAGDNSVLAQLQRFEVAVNSLRADGGGDYPEYALDAMLAALDYSFTDEYGAVTPMGANSRMVVITDATSKNQALEATVIERARVQGVAIHFILPDHSRLRSYSVYSNIAAQTEGHVYINPHSSWSIVNFQLGLTTPGLGDRRRRSAPRAPSFTPVSFNVSRFSTSLRLSTYSRSSRIAVNLSIPAAAPEELPIEDHVAIYLTSNPAAGNYTLRTSGRLVNVVIQQDISLDVSVIYMDIAATSSAFNPPPACTSGKIVLTTSRIGEISSLILNETGPGGSSRLLPLTKCSNAFTRDHHFRAGTFYYQIQGVDTNGVEFAYNFNRSAVVSIRPSLYSLRPTSTSPLPVEYSTPFTVGFVLRNNDSIGSTDFTLSAAAPGFTVSLDSSTVQLLPKHTRTITVTGRVGSTVGGGTSHPLTLTASNGCVTLTTSRTVTVRAVVSTPSPEPSPVSNVCGCQNGGTCNILVRRGRTFRSCSCTDYFRGIRCETRV